MMYSKLDINRNIKTTDNHARDMHMVCFFFSKAVLHNILKLLSLGQLLQQFIPNTTTVHNGTPRKSEQSALPRRQLNLGDGFNRSPFHMGEGWGRMGPASRRESTRKRNKNRLDCQEEQVQDVALGAAEKGQAKTLRPPTRPPPLPPKMYDLKLLIPCIRPRIGKI